MAGIATKVGKGPVTIICKAKWAREVTKGIEHWELMPQLAGGARARRK
jgi:hypothetical protein